jgi:hypothetical protein
MIFVSLVAHLKDRLAKRAEFRRQLAEINTLSDRDLQDLRADRVEMIRYAHNEVYGASAA